MPHQATSTPSCWRPGAWEATPEQDQARLELLESLPVRLERAALAKVMALHDDGKADRTIGWKLSLDPLIVTLEVRREDERRARETATSPIACAATEVEEADHGLARLTRFEMNRMARGTHIPNQPIRALIAGALKSNPDLTVTAILTAAGYKSTSQGRRLLGYMRNAGSDHYGQTIRAGDAARVVRAMGRDPVEVVGL
jgi:hypothetical protein